MMNKKESLTLRVEEAFPRDQGRALARICYSFLKDWGIEVGDVIELQSCREGGKKVGVVVIPSKNHDRGVTIVRIDCYIRKNLQVTLGELVKIRRITRRPAKMITIAPAEDKIRLLVKPKVLKQRIQNHPVVQGEELVLTGKIHKLLPERFQTDVPVSVRIGMIRVQVVATDPPGIVVVGADTEVRVQAKLQRSTTVRQSEPYLTQHRYSKATEYN